MCCVTVIFGGAFASAQRAGNAQPTRSTGVTVAPLQIRKLVQTGTTTKDKLSVQSLEEVPMQIRVRVNSVLFSEWTYAPQFGVQHSRDAAPWFGQREIIKSLRPFEKAEFPLSAVIPRTIGGRTNVYWAMATVELAVPSEPTRILPSFQIPLIYLIGRPVRPDVKIGSPELSVGKSGGTVYVPFTNDSAAYTPISAFITVRNLSTGRILQTAQESGRNLYPESKRRLPFALGRLGPGQYLISAATEIGSRRLPAVTAKYTVTESSAHPLTPSESYTIAPVQVDPPFVGETLTPGAQRSRAIRITNTSDHPLNVAIMARTLTQSSTGSLELNETAIPAHVSLTASPDSVQIPAKGTVSVRLVLAVEQGASGENCFGIALKDMDAKSSFSGLATAVLSVKGTLAPKLTLAPGEIRRNLGYPYSFEYTIVNDGNQALQPITSATLFDNAGTRAIAGLNVPLLGDGGILPGAKLENRVAIPTTLQPGAYVVEIDYQYGPDLRATLRVPFKVDHALTGHG